MNTSTGLNTTEWTARDDRLMKGALAPLEPHHRLPSYFPHRSKEDVLARAEQMGRAR